MQSPLVSVKMVTYNHEAYIRKAIDSVLAQKTTFPFELVIGEDCSTDATRSIAFAYANRHPDVIRLITSEQNVGALKNDQRTHSACRGKYIAFCEGDDYWQRDDKLQLQVNYLENHPEYGLVSSDYDTYDTKTNLRVTHCRTKSAKSMVQSPTIIDIVSGRADILTCTVLARREMVEQIKAADPYLHQSEHFRMGDTQLWAELSLRAKVFIHDESLATRQLLQESATQSNNREKTLQFWASNAELAIYLCKKHHLPEALRDAHARDWTRKSLQLALLAKSSEMAEMVKRKSPALSLKNRVWYWGAKHAAVRPFVLLFQSIFRKGL